MVGQYSMDLPKKIFHQISHDIMNPHVWTFFPWCALFFPSEASLSGSTGFQSGAASADPTLAQWAPEASIFNGKITEFHEKTWKFNGKIICKCGNGPLPRLITRGYGLALFFLVLRLVFLLGRSLMQIQRLFFKTAISDWRPTWAQIWWSSKLITDCQRQRMVPFPSDTGSSWAVASGRHVCSKT